MWTKTGESRLRFRKTKTLDMYIAGNIEARIVHYSSALNRLDVAAMVIVTGLAGKYLDEPTILKLSNELSLQMSLAKVVRPSSAVAVVNSEPVVLRLLQESSSTKILFSAADCLVQELPNTWSNTFEAETCCEFRAATVTCSVSATINLKILNKATYDCLRAKGLGYKSLPTLPRSRTAELMMIKSQVDSAGAGESVRRMQDPAPEAVASEPQASIAATASGGKVVKFVKLFFGRE